MSEAPRLLLHGFLGCGADFAAWLEVGENDIVLDLPGHGTAPDLGPLQGDPEGGFERCLAWIEAQVEASGVGPVDVVGYSMGGRLAYGLLARGNIEACGAVLIGASPGIEDPDERARRAAADDVLAASLEDGPLGERLDAWYEQPLFGRIAASEGWPATRKRRLEGSPPHLALALRNLTIGRQPSYWDALGDIDIEQIVLVAGAEDAKFVEINARAAERMPRTATLRIAGTAHAVQIERPALTGQLVRAFLV